MSRSECLRSGRDKFRISANFGFHQNHLIPPGMLTFQARKQVNNRLTHPFVFPVSIDNNTIDALHMTSLLIEITVMLIKSNCFKILT